MRKDHKERCAVAVAVAGALTIGAIFSPVDEPLAADAGETLRCSLVTSVANAEATFLRLDRDGNGVITREELLSCRGMEQGEDLPDDMEERFGRWDTNTDRMLSRGEVQAALLRRSDRPSSSLSPSSSADGDATDGDATHGDATADDGSTTSVAESRETIPPPEGRGGDTSDPANSDPVHMEPAGGAASDRGWLRVEGGHLLGLEVVDSHGEPVGELKGIVLDRRSGDAYALVSSGGFLGLGAREVVVPFGALDVTTHRLTMSGSGDGDASDLRDYEPEAYRTLWLAD